MKKGNYTRDQAVALVGEALVSKIESLNCEPTNRVGFNGACQGDELCEWSASASALVNGEQLTVVAYHYTTNEQDQSMADADGDGSAINWTVSGYEIF